MAEKIKFSGFKSDLRDAVLASIDTFAAGHTDRTKGWCDEDLPKLFAGVDAHALTLANRINKCHAHDDRLIQFDLEQ